MGTISAILLIILIGFYVYFSIIDYLEVTIDILDNNDLMWLFVPIIKFKRSLTKENILANSPYYLIRDIFIATNKHIRLWLDKEIH